MSFGLYLHIPFCQKKCGYCDFTSYAGKGDMMSLYVSALAKEMELVANTASTKALGDVATVYVGGGTPTALPPFLLFRLIEKVKEIFLRKEQFSQIEFTVEVNPKTVDKNYLLGLWHRGVNRLSFGVQSFQDDLLRLLGRIHKSKDAEEIIFTAQKIGFKNISIDLMYALPTEKKWQVESDLRRAVALNIEHISIYGLQIEENTAFFKLREKGNLILPTEDEAGAMYDFMTEFLPQHGYQRYEISNFSRPSYESQHNLGYWEDRAYLGLGVSASSYYGGRRYRHTHDLNTYIQNLREEKIPFISEDEGANEEQVKRYRMAEFCFLALRTAKGIDTTKFLQKFGKSFFDVYGTQVEILKNKGLINVYNVVKESNEIFVCLTKNGMKYGNYAFEQFLI